MPPVVKQYSKSMQDEDRLTKKQLELRNVGLEDPKRHLEDAAKKLLTDNIVQCLGSMLAQVAFK